MPTITTSNITASIEPMWGDRSRRITWGSSTARLPYVVEVLDPGNAADIDTLEEYVIHAALEFFAANPVGGMFFVEMEIDSTINDHTWKVFASYDGRGMWYADSGSGDITAEAEFDTVGGQQHITASRNTAGKYPSDAVYPGGINAVGDEIKGVDIIVPGFNFTITRHVEAGFWNASYLNTLRRLTATINDGEWYGYTRGEVLFIGASVQRRGMESVRIVYKFSSLLSQTAENGNPVIVPGFVFKAGGPAPPPGFAVGDLIPIDKLGWQLLWVTFTDDVEGEGANKRAIKRPTAAFVEDVYQYTNFGELGL